MNRREAAIALVALGAAPALFAQSVNGMARIALVDPVEAVADMAESGGSYWGALLGELRRLGRIEGRTLAVERWSAHGEGASAHDLLARKIVSSRPRAIVAFGRNMITAIAAATTEIPIVAIGTIPVGLRDSLARPGRNVTGIHVSADEQQLYGKQLEFLREITKAGARIAWLGDEVNWNSAIGEAFRVGAKQTGLTIQPVFTRTPVNAASVRRSLEGVTAKTYDALLVSPSSELFPLRAAIADLAAKARLPTIGFNSYYAESGLVMSYGADFGDVFRRAAQHVNKILSGAKPGELPIEFPTRLELVVNQRAAKSVGLKVPQSVLIRADRVIE